MMVSMKKMFVFDLSIVNTVNIFCCLIDVNWLLACLFLTVSILFFRLKKMSSKEISDDDIVDSNTLFEIAIIVFICLNTKIQIVILIETKNRYFRRLWDFIVKLKRKYYQMSEEEVSNFLTIYPLCETGKDNFFKSEFLFNDRIYIDRLSWVGPNLG